MFMWETLLWGIIGITIGYIGDKIWWDNIVSLRRWEKENKLFNYLEHYHWGVFSVLLSDSSRVGLMLLGYGAFTLYKEARQGHPFSFGSGHFLKSLIIGVVFAIAGLALGPFNMLNL